MDTVHVKDRHMQAIGIRSSCRVFFVYPAIFDRSSRSGSSFFCRRFRSRSKFVIKSLNGWLRSIMITLSCPVSLVRKVDKREDTNVLASSDFSTKSGQKVAFDLSLLPLRFLPARRHIRQTVMTINARMNTISVLLGASICVSWAGQKNSGNHRDESGWWLLLLTESSWYAYYSIFPSTYIYDVKRVVTR